MALKHWKKSMKDRWVKHYEWGYDVLWIQHTSFGTYVHLDTTIQEDRPPFISKTSGRFLLKMGTPEEAKRIVMQYRKIH